MFCYNYFGDRKVFTNKKILILGFARSGYEAAKVLLKRNNIVIINDSKEEKFHDQEKINELKRRGCQFIFGSHPTGLLDASFDYLLKNPGITPKHQYVLDAHNLNIPVINEVEMAYLLLPDKITLIAITGTNGKTTTTTLIYEMIKESGKRVHLTGNIGYPLCSFLDDLQANDIIVMETSCQQLVNLNKFHPNICVMTNLSEAHLDFLDNYDNYKFIKSKIYQNMTKDDYLILNHDNYDLYEMTKNIEITNKEYFSITGQGLCFYKDGFIYYNHKEFIDTKEIILKGLHNYENIMASIMALKKLNISDIYIKRVLTSFKGVPHRLEYVTSIKGILFYNDSKATNIKSTQIALSSFESPIILILGGLERHQDFHELDQYMLNTKLIVCYGENKERIMEFGNDLKIPTIMCNNLKEAVLRCYNKALKGDIILLSPASASWDQYKCFEDRGLEFKEEINKLNEQCN